MILLKIKIYFKKKYYFLLNKIFYYFLLNKIIYYFFNIYTTFYKNKYNFYGRK